MPDHATFADMTAKTLRWPRLLALLLLSCAWWMPRGARGQTNQSLVLADVEGFTDSDLYPIGNLQPVQDGQAS